MKLSSANKILNNIDIVLVSPQVPENIGLVARALKNTSFYNLSLVDPCLTKKSFEVAKRAQDILKKAKIFNAVEEAVKSSYFVFGTTRRPRKYKMIYDFNDVKNLLISMASKKRISILFGKENFGLSKREVELCDSVFYIPSNVDFPSYNIANATGIVCYELYNSIKSLCCAGFLELAPKKEIESLFSYLEKWLEKRLSKQKVKPALLSLQRLFLRTHLTKNEVSLIKSLILKEGKIIK